MSSLNVFRNPFPALTGDPHVVLGTSPLRCQLRRPPQAGQSHDFTPPGRTGSSGPGRVWGRFEAGTGVGFEDRWSGSRRSGYGSSHASL